MSRAQVVEILGKPRAIQRSSSTKEYAYRYRGMIVVFSQLFNDVLQIISTRTGVGTANGVRVGAPGTLVKRRFPKARCVTRRGVQFCTVKRGKSGATGYVIKGGTITEIDVLFV
jgi:hypothetical protein